MNFVKSLSIFHVNSKEIPCLTAKGAPTEQTEGAPGVLYMDTDTGELHKCTAADYVNRVFTWKPLLEGNSSPDSGQNGDGLTTTEKNLILSLFKNAAYTADMSTTIAQLETLWNETPDAPESGVEQIGSVLSIVSGVTVNQSGSVLAIA